MKKFLLVGLVSIFACSVDANAAQISTTNLDDLSSVSVCASSGPKVVKRGDRVIIIYGDGTTIIVDKDGSTIVVPNK